MKKHEMTVDLEKLDHFLKSDEGQAKLSEAFKSADEAIRQDAARSGNGFNLRECLEFNRQQRLYGDTPEVAPLPCWCGEPGANWYETGDVWLCSEHWNDLTQDAWLEQQDRHLQ